MFRDRTDAGLQLAERLRDRPLRHPIVLGIPRGGMVTGAALAKELGAELDLVLSRKLRAPGQPEVAIGAIAEDGKTQLNSYGEELLTSDRSYVEQERTFQLREIGRRRRLFRRVRSKASLADRTVILVDDGIATGSTMLAALHVIRHEQPHEVLVAVPVGSPDRLDQIRALCDEMICLLAPDDFWAIGPFYEDFTQVEDEEVLRLLEANGTTCARA